MLTSFLLGTVFGAVLFFMARIADKKTEAFLVDYTRRGSLLRRKPVIVDMTEKQQPDDILDEMNGV